MRNLIIKEHCKPLNLSAVLRCFARKLWLDSSDSKKLLTAAAIIIVVVPWLESHPKPTLASQRYSEQRHNFCFTRNGQQSVASENCWNYCFHLDESEFVPDAIAGPCREGQECIRIPLLAIFWGKPFGDELFGVRKNVLKSMCGVGNHKDFRVRWQRNFSALDIFSKATSKNRNCGVKSAIKRVLMRIFTKPLKKFNPLESQIQQYQLTVKLL